MEWLAVIVIGVLAFVLLHLRPLTPGEIRTLAQKWRQQENAVYFSFRHSGVAANPDFKRSMAANGRLYSICEPFSAFPSIGALLLKGKKHEWVIVGFEREQSVVLAWMNKGSDNTQVEFRVSVEEIANVALIHGCTSVLILHNHPNPNPARYDMSQPSSTDLIGSAERGAQLSSLGINLVEFVCERGWPHEYRRVISEGFRPVVGYEHAIFQANGQARVAHLQLHLARLFGSSDFRSAVVRAKRSADTSARRQADRRAPKPRSFSAPTAWYPDPAGVHQHRYWDGNHWCDWVSNDGVVAACPMVDGGPSNNGIVSVTLLPEGCLKSAFR